MNLGVICNVNTKQPLAVIGVDNKNKLVGYMTNDNDLETIINIILDNDTLELPVKEEINGNDVLRYDNIDCSHTYYLIAINYHLPYPYKILGVTYADGDLEQLIQESFQYMEGFLNE